MYKTRLGKKTGPLQEPKPGLSLPKERTITCHDRNLKAIIGMIISRLSALEADVVGTISTATFTSSTSLAGLTSSSAELGPGVF